MTVQTLLKSLTQRELCHWIAFHQIEREEYDKKYGHDGDQQRQPQNQEPPPAGEQKIIVKQNANVPQSQKDMLMLQQLLALTQCKQKKE